MNMIGDTLSKKIEKSRTVFKKEDKAENFV